ncbi:MAG: hypothetical protein HY093_00020 [Candidatus Liptonbacteria bacterium]|nr:hypothetical protein [Candidatus Liptonbacteria bacterium]
MVEKLKLILKPTPWSLVVKALIFGGAWLVLPFWLFLLIASYFYFVPLFKPLKFIRPFSIFLVLISPLFAKASLGLAAVTACIFFLILGVKDLVFVNRKPKYEIAIYLIYLLLFWVFFSSFENWLGTGVVFGSLGLAAVFFLLTRSFLNYEEILNPVSLEMGVRGGSNLEGRKGEGVYSRETLAAVFVALLVWQLVWVLLFLPFNRIYQTATVFLMVVLVLETILAHFNHSLTRKRLLVNFTAIFVFMVLTLASLSFNV